MRGRFSSSLTDPKIPGFEWQEATEPSDLINFRHILDYGCTILDIIPDDDHPALPFDYLYTVGFHVNLLHSELMLVGRDAEDGARMLNDIFDYVESGSTISQDESLTYDLGRGEERFIARAVPEERYFDYLGWGCWFYRSLWFGKPSIECNFPVLQLCWADSSGAYPWEDDCDPNVKRIQELVPQPTPACPGPPAAGEESCGIAKAQTPQ